MRAKILHLVNFCAMPPQRLGQHFLTDAGWRARILKVLHVKGDEVWLEIGAGHGEMTALLARDAARLIAVELDLRLAQRLHELAREFPNLEVVPRDVLDLEIPLLPNAVRLHVYGNLPYYITSPILHRLFQYADRVSSIHVVIQFEVAARLVARPGRRQYGYLSVLTQFYARPEIVFRIPPGAFHPSPKVASALVSMRLPGERATLGIPNESNFLQLVKTCFTQKRKTLLNNLRSMLGAKKSERILDASGLARDARAEQLTVAQFAHLYRQIVGS